MLSCMLIIVTVIWLLCQILLLVFKFLNWDAEEKVRVKIKLFEGGKLPVFKTKGAVAADCYARLEETVSILPHTRTLIPLGFACGLPEGYEIQVRPRSGLSSKYVDVTLGTGDIDYTGEYKACVINNTDKTFEVSNGDRICQIAIREAPKIEFKLVNELEETERGSNGFGSTGLKE